MSRPVLALLGLALAACTGGERAAWHPADPCTIARVKDGDTVACTDGRTTRLLGIDAPEKDQGTFGMSASLELDRLIPAGTTVAVEMDQEPTDRYGRTLAYLRTRSGVLVNVEMARRGYVVPLTYRPNVAHAQEIDAATAEAYAAGRGLWAEGGFDCPPREHRRHLC